MVCWCFCNNVTRLLPRRPCVMSVRGPNNGELTQHNGRGTKTANLVLTNVTSRYCLKNLSAKLHLLLNKSFCKRPEIINVTWRSRQNMQVIALLSDVLLRKLTNVGGAVQTDLTLLRYLLAITERTKCWELLAEKFDRFQTLRSNCQQHATGCANGRNM